MQSTAAAANRPNGLKDPSGCKSIYLSLAVVVSLMRNQLYASLFEAPLDCPRWHFDAAIVLCLSPALSRSGPPSRSGPAHAAAASHAAATCLDTHLPSAMHAHFSVNTIDIGCDKLRPPKVPPLARAACPKQPQLWSAHSVLWRAPPSRSFHTASHSKQSCFTTALNMLRLPEAPHLRCRSC